MSHPGKNDCEFKPGDLLQWRQGTHSPFLLLKIEQAIKNSYKNSYLYPTISVYSLQDRRICKFALTDKWSKLKPKEETEENV